MKRKKFDNNRHMRSIKSKTQPKDMSADELFQHIRNEIRQSLNKKERNFKDQ